VALGLLSILLIVLAGFWFYGVRTRTELFESYLSRLEQEPGIVVTSSRNRNRKLEITGLRDPAAEDPAQIRKELGIDLTQTVETWEAYIALHPEIVRRRSIKYLNPPNTVSIRVEEDTLHLAGSAPIAWIDGVQQTALSVPGVRQVETGELISEEGQTVSRIEKELSSIRLLFDRGQSQLRTGQEDQLEDIVDKISSAIAIARKIDYSIEIRITGHADPIGTDVYNQNLSHQRATSIRSILISRGIPSELIQAVGMGESEAVEDTDTSSLRNVRFQLQLAPNGTEEE
jgi:OOP family OmpA-OmpF porin